MSGLPVFDRDRNLRGYRGFGVCRDVPRIDELTRLRTGSVVRRAPRRGAARRAAGVPRAGVPRGAAAEAGKRRAVPRGARRKSRRRCRRSSARRSASLQAASPRACAAAATRSRTTPEPRRPRRRPSRSRRRCRESCRRLLRRSSAPHRAASLRPRPAPKSPPADQRPILDRLPVGVLVYRLDKLIYANRAFLDWTGYGALDALEEAGGLDALFVEPTEDDAGTEQRREVADHRHQQGRPGAGRRRGCSPRRGTASRRWC